MVAIIATVGKRIADRVTLHIPTANFPIRSSIREALIAASS
ncbi:hypothetical protein [Mesorhizobium sp. M0678]